MEYGYIYIIKNKINEKVYIGQTLRSVEERFKQHMKPSNHKKHYKLYRAMNKYGNDNFYYEILESNVCEDIIDEREIYWIEKYDSYKNGYNSTPGGDGRVIFKNIDINYIVDELKKGKSIKELSCEFNVSRETIKRSLIRYDYKIKDIQNRKIVNSNAQKKINRNVVRELHEQGKSVKEIANELNCNVKTIRRIKHELNLDFERPRYDYTNINDDNIIKDKLNGMKVEDILDKYNISYGYYYKLWKEYKIECKEKSNDYPEKE